MQSSYNSEIQEDCNGKRIDKEHDVQKGKRQYIDPRFFEAETDYVHHEFSADENQCKDYENYPVPCKEKKSRLNKKAAVLGFGKMAGGLAGVFGGKCLIVSAAITAPTGGLSTIGVLGGLTLMGVGMLTWTESLVDTTSAFQDFQEKETSSLGLAKENVEQNGRKPNN